MLRLVATAAVHEATSYEVLDLLEGDGANCVHCVQDWDLKMEKGNCLNYLGRETFEVGYPPSSSATVPKAVKRVHEIFENPTFMKNVSSSEIIQGSIGNCWAVAALSALADVVGGIQRLCVAHDTRKYTSSTPPKLLTPLAVFGAAS